MYFPLEYMLGCVMVGGGIMTCDSACIGEYCEDFSNARARLLLKMSTKNQDLTEGDNFDETNKEEYDK